MLVCVRSPSQSQRPRKRKKEKKAIKDMNNSHAHTHTYILAQVQWLKLLLNLTALPFAIAMVSKIQDAALDKYARALEVGEVLSEYDCAGLVGRLCRGTQEVDFRRLSWGPARVAWVMDPVGLAQLTAQKRHIEVLRLVGFDLTHCKAAYQEGQHFRLGLLAAPEGPAQATWDGVLAMVDRLCPSIAEKVRHREAELRALRSEIQASPSP